MKTFIEKLKDFLYDSIDYLIIIAIIVAVVGVIGWRLDVLFAKDTLETAPLPVVVDETDPDNMDDYIVDEEPNSPSNPQDSDEVPSYDTVEDPIDDTIDDNPDKPGPDISESDSSPAGLVTITIPDGTLPSGIGTILESNGLVTSKNDFVIQAQSLGLDRSLRSGTFEISSNSSLDEIIRIIAHQN